MAILATDAALKRGYLRTARARIEHDSTIECAGRGRGEKVDAKRIWLGLQSSACKKTGRNLGIQIATVDARGAAGGDVVRL